MPITLEDLNRDTRTCTVEFAGASAEVTYKPTGYTPETEDRFQSALDSKRSTQAFVEFIASTVIAWDVLDDNQQPYPLEIEDLRKLPGRFLTAVVNAITRDMREELDENRKNSGNGSSGQKPQRARTVFRS